MSQQNPTRTLILIGIAALLITLTLALLPLGAPPSSYAQAGPTTPPEVYGAAIAYNSANFPELARPSSWRHEIIYNITTSNLNCPLQPAGSTIEATAVYRLWLTIGGLEYFYHVKADGSVVVPCDAKLLEDDSPDTLNTGCEAVIGPNAVTIFIEADASSTALDALSNTNLPVIARSEDSIFYRVSFDNGRAGWVIATSVGLQGTCENLPVGDDSLTPLSGCNLSMTLTNVRSSPDASSEANILFQVNDAQGAGIGRTSDSVWWFMQLADGRSGWVANSAVTEIGDCESLPIMGASVQDYGPCPPGFSPEYMVSGLAVNTVAQIESGGEPNVVRAEPSRTAERRGLYNPGTTIFVLSGPQCGAGYVWWEVVDESGLRGWTVESLIDEQAYYIEALGPGSAVPQGDGSYVITQTGSSSSTGTGTGAGTGTGTDSGAFVAPPAQSQVITSATISSLQRFTTLSRPEATTFDAAYSPDGQWFAVRDTLGVRVFALPSYQEDSTLSEILTPADPSILTTAMAFSADSRYLVLGYSNGFIWVADLQETLAFRVAAQHEQQINAIAFSSENVMASVSGEPSAPAPGSLQIFDFALMNPVDGTLPRLFVQFYEQGLWDVAFASSEVVGVRLDGRVDAWNFGNGTQVLEQAASTSSRAIALAKGFANVQGIVFSGAVGAQQTLLAWSVGDTFALSLSPITLDGVSDILVIAAPNSTDPVMMVSGGTASAQTVLFYNSNFDLLRSETADYTQLAVSPDGRTVAAVAGSGVDLWIVP